MIMGLHLFHIYDIREYHLVVYFLWIAPLGALTLLFSSYLLCNRNVYLGTFFGANSLYLFGILLLIPATFIFDITLRIKSLWLLIFCVTTIIATIQSFILFFKMRDVLERSFSYFFKKTISDQARKKEWWEVSLRLIFNQFVYLIVSALDLILLEIIDPNEAVVGYYAAALTVTGLIWMTQLALFQHISPMISSSIETENDKKELQVLINKAQINNIVLNSILIALITIFTNPILKFFGPEYLAAKIPLWILLGATFISLLSTPASKLLAYSGNEKSLLFISILQVTTMLISGVILISLFGMIGAALAVMTTLLVRGIASIYFVRIKLAMRTVIFV
jgi:O-antigen/teichoic acid export membrane protein